MSSDRNNVVDLAEFQRDRWGRMTPEEKIEEMFGPRDPNAPYGAPGVVISHRASMSKPPAPSRPVQ